MQISCICLLDPTTLGPGPVQSNFCHLIRFTSINQQLVRVQVTKLAGKCVNRSTGRRLTIQVLSNPVGILSAHPTCVSDKPRLTLIWPPPSYPFRVKSFSNWFSICILDLPNDIFKEERERIKNQLNSRVVSQADHYKSPFRDELRWVVHLLKKESFVLIRRPCLLYLFELYF